MFLFIFSKASLTSFSLQEIIDCQSVKRGTLKGISQEYANLPDTACKIGETIQHNACIVVIKMSSTSHETIVICTRGISKQECYKHLLQFDTSTCRLHWTVGFDCSHYHFEIKYLKMMITRKTSKFSSIVMDDALGWWVHQVCSKFTAKLSLVSQKRKIF